MRPPELLLAVLLLLSYSAAGPAPPSRWQGCTKSGTVTCFATPSCHGETDELEKQSLKLMEVPATTANCEIVLKAEKKPDIAPDIYHVMVRFSTGTLKANFVLLNRKIRMETIGPKIKFFCDDDVVSGKAFYCKNVQYTTDGNAKLVTVLMELKNKAPPSPTLAPEIPTLAPTTKTLATTTEHHEEEEEHPVTHHEDHEDAEHEPHSGEGMGMGSIIAIVAGVLLFGICATFIVFYVRNSRRQNVILAAIEAANGSPNGSTGSTPRVGGNNNSSSRKGNKSLMQKVTGVFSGEKNKPKKASEAENVEI